MPKKLTTTRFQVPTTLPRPHQNSRIAMESQPKSANPIKFLCSYGGKILPRLTDGTLRYSGGHTRVITHNPSTSFSELIEKLGELCGSSPVTLKCQLPNGDLETLISITSDEDLANIIDEYDRASSSLNSPLKIRAILSPPKKLSSPPPSSSSSSASYSPSGSPHAYSPPSAAAYRLNRCSRVPFGYPIGVRKGCWYTRHVDGSFAGSPRFWGASLQ